jgi:hypothetical protein
MYPHWYHYRTNCFCTGTTGAGKTAWLEDCQRDRIMVGQGFCSLIFDQDHWDRLIEYLAYLNPRQPVIRLNLSQSDFIVPCNWFSYPTGEIGAHADRLATAIAGSGQMLKNLADMQNYANVMPAVIRWCAETHQPIQKAEWLGFGNQAAILEAARMASHPRTIAELNLLAGITRYSDWSFRVGSTWNRLRLLSDSLPLRRFTGANGTLNLQDAVDKRAIVLVNLTPRDGFTFDAAAFFASLILSEFSTVSGNYFLDLDEAPHYVTYDVVRMLDLMCKKGLRVTLLAHDPQQFEGARILVSLGINAKIRVVFGGMQHEERKKLVPDFFPAQLGERWEKERFFGYHGHDETFEEHTTGVSEWSHEEKLSSLAGKLVLERQDYLVQLPDGVSTHRVPDLERFLISPARILEFNTRHPRGILPEEIDRQLIGETHVRTTPNRKRPRPLSPQH